MKFAFRSEITQPHPVSPGEIDCLLVNTTGELKYFYEHATVIFVGKSLTAQGGQNPIEPGALGKPMVFGPNMQNFADIVRAASWRRTARCRRATRRNWKRSWRELLADGARREELGRNALKVVHENLGAIDRTVDMIVKHLDNGELYIAPRRCQREVLSRSRRHERRQSRRRAPGHFALPAPLSRRLNALRQDSASFVEEDAFEIHLQRLRVRWLCSALPARSPCPASRG